MIVGDFLSHVYGRAIDAMNAVALCVVMFFATGWQADAGNVNRNSRIVLSAQYGIEIKRFCPVISPPLSVITCTLEIADYPTKIVHSMSWIPSDAGCPRLGAALRQSRTKSLS